MPTTPNLNRLYHLRPHPQGNPHFVRGADNQERGRNRDSKKEENGEKYVTATTEAEFHAALNRGFAVEVTWELADEIGVPMNEDVGTVAEIDQARYDRHD